MHKARIILCEDDPQLASSMVRLLKRQGHEVASAATASELLEQLAAASWDLILLDLDLPDGDGVAIARQLRSRSKVPLIMVTGRTSSEDIVVGLDAGADDYIVKPFESTELVARVRSTLRRFGPSKPVPAELISGEIRIGVLTLLLPTRTLQIDERSECLTEREMLILLLLHKHTGAPVSRDQMYRELFGREWDGFDRSADVHVTNLRKKLRAMGLEQDPIQSVRGVGYRLLKA